MRWTGLAIFWGLFLLADVTNAAYYGKSLGKLSEFHHAVSGHVYAVDGRTLFIKDFTYDGEGPAAYFYVGNSKAPSNNGATRLRDERGSSGVLRRYRKKDITLTLPEGKTFHSIKWFSIWCDEFSVNFGDVKIPKNLDYPKPQKISALSGVHGVSSDPIVIVDTQTLLIPNFSYDGEAPDAKFWVGRGDKPSPQGIKIPDENGKISPLRQYDHKTIVLTLPSDLTISDIGHFGVWCEAFTVDFGHVKIPASLNIPPSLKMLGVSPQKRNQQLLLSSASSPTHTSSSTQTVKPQVLQQQSNLRPTTYRPPRLLATGVDAVELAYPIAQSDVHRRADNFQPPQVQQIVTYDKPLIQPSMEIYVNHEPPIYYQPQQLQLQQSQSQLQSQIQPQLQLRNLYRTHQIHPRQYQVHRSDLELDLQQQLAYHQQQQQQQDQGRAYHVNNF